MRTFEASLEHMARTRPVTERVRHFDKKPAKSESKRRQMQLRTMHTIVIGEEVRMGRASTIRPLVLMR